MVFLKEAAVVEFAFDDDLSIFYYIDIELGEEL